MMSEINIYGEYVYDNYCRDWRQMLSFSATIIVVIDDKCCHIWRQSSYLTTIVVVSTVYKELKTHYYYQLIELS